MARLFNPSNEPNTCPYCGTRLAKHKVVEHRYTQTITLCCQAPVELGVERAQTLAGWENAKRCSRCRRKVVGDDEDTEQVEKVAKTGGGKDGYDGVFCTLDCGYRFGRLAADKGVRYQRAQDETD